MPAATYPGTTTPGPLLQSALDYVNAQLQRMVDEIHQQGLSRLDGDHRDRQARPVAAGSGPAAPDRRRRRSSPRSTTRGSADGCTSNCTPLIVAGTDDDLWQSYLSDKLAGGGELRPELSVEPQRAGQSPTTARPWRCPTRVWRRSTPARRPPTSSACPSPTRATPTCSGVVQVGVVYTTGTKIAEHGGDNPADRDVPILVYAPGTVSPALNGQSVETTQVAPTILALLGLNPNALQAVQIEHTQVLPGISDKSTVTVSAVNLAGSQITGYYTTLWQNGAPGQELLLPCSFTVTNGQTYQVMAASYGSETFNHWLNDGSTGPETVKSSTTTIIRLTAVYSP